MKEIVKLMLSDVGAWIALFRSLGLRLVLLVLLL